MNSYRSKTDRLSPPRKQTNGDERSGKGEAPLRERDRMLIEIAEITKIAASALAAIVFVIGVAFIALIWS